MDRERFLEEIAKIAYEMYENRGRSDGHAMDDWLEAERIVLHRHAAEVSREAAAIRNRTAMDKAVKAPTTAKKSTGVRKAGGKEGPAAVKKTAKKTASKTLTKKK